MFFSVAILLNRQSNSLTLSFRLVRNLSENKERSPTSEDDGLGYSVAWLIIQVCPLLSLCNISHSLLKKTSFVQDKSSGLRDPAQGTLSVSCREQRGSTPEGAAGRLSSSDFFLAQRHNVLL